MLVLDGLYFSEVADESGADGGGVTGGLLREGLVMVIFG